MNKNTVNLDNVQAENLDFAVNQRQAAALTRAKVALEQCLNTIKNNLPLHPWARNLCNDQIRKEIKNFLFRQII